MTHPLSPAIVFAAVLLAATPGMAQTETGTISSRLVSLGCVDQFPHLPQIAERLGVKPGTGADGSVVLSMCDGSVYDLSALINALLDRMDAANNLRPPQ